MRKPAAAKPLKGAHGPPPRMPKDGESVKFRGGKILASASRGGWRVWPNADVVTKEKTVKFGSDKKASFLEAVKLI
eukprot:2506836-Pyramimonas_sp.AAC.1